MAMAVPGIIGQIREFDRDGDDWTLYSETLEQYFAANQIVEATVKVGTLITLIGQSTYKLLRDLTFPTLPKDKTYDELKKILNKHLCQHVSVNRERVAFHEGRQEEGESASKWYARVRSLAVNCRFANDLEAMLKQQFLGGMRKGRVLDRICEEDSSTSLADLVKLAVQRESIPMKSADINWAGREGARPNSNAMQHHRKQGERRSCAGATTAASVKKRRWPTGNENRQMSKCCKVCGKMHGSVYCKYTSYKCRNCNSYGHLEAVCKKRVHNQNYLDEYQEVNNEQFDIFSLDSLYFADSPMESNPFIVKVYIDKKCYEMAVDTGAGVTVINKNVYNANFKNYVLDNDNIRLRSYTGSTIQPLGYFYAKTSFNSVTKDVKYYVVDRGGPSLLGRDFLDVFKIGLNVANIRVLEIDNVQKKVVEKFPEVFCDELGKFKFLKVSLQIKPDTKPIFFKPRPVPLAYKQQIEDQLDSMAAEGIIQPVTASDWGTPIVPVLKTDGTIRICGDYKATLNKHLENVRYPLPRIEEIFVKLNGGERFTTLDLSKAYLQYELEEKSQEMCTWSTHKGLFKVRRMPFGVSSASAICQRSLEQCLQGLEGVINYCDDIIVTGKDTSTHIKNLEAVLSRLKEAGLTVKQEKCQFFKRELEYLGHRITKEGLRKTDTKVKAIVEAPRPTNVSEVRTFTGLVNYYGKFVKGLANILSPIYKLLTKEGKFDWNDECEHAFKSIKRLIAEDITLTYFDPNKPIVLVTDASMNGISAVLCHRENGVDKPIACASRTYMPAEKNWATVDREGLAIIFGLRKYHQYLVAQKVTIKTDHKPLVGLFGEHKGIPQRNRDRLQRWAVYLSGFDYKIEYIKGRDNVMADYLSRMPLKTFTKSNEYEHQGYLNFATADSQWPIDCNRVVEATKRDNVLNKVVKFIHEGWPKEIEEQIKPYYHRKDELTEERGCLLWGYRVVIPQELRGAMLEELHAGHLGIVKTKSLARSYLWWPKLDQEIESTIKACVPCLKTHGDPPKTVLTPWPIAKRPMERIHMDFAGPLQGKMFLIIIDSYTKWPEIYVMNQITSKETEVRLRDLFGRFGLADTVVTDNGRSFVSEEMQHFFARNGIRHLTSPPFNPASNGAAENAVKTFKSKLKSALDDPKNKHVDLNTLISRFLLSYRNCEHCTTKATPAELMFGRRLKTRLDLLRQPVTGKVPEKVEASMKRQQEKQITLKGGRNRKFEKGEEVMVRDYRKLNSKQWTEAQVEKKIGRTIYLCRLPTGEQWKRHTNQIAKRGAGQARVERPELNKEATSRAKPGETSKIAFSALPPDISVGDPPRVEQFDDVNNTVGECDDVNILLSNDVNKTNVNNFKTVASNRKTTTPGIDIRKSVRRKNPPDKYKDFIVEF